MSASRQRNSRTHALLVSLALLGCVAAIAGCGGSSSGGSSATHTETTQGQPTPVQSNPDVQQVGSAAGQPKSGVTATASDKAEASGSGSAAGVTDLSKPSPTAFNPCKLVSLSEAKAITGGAITSRFEAPLGPTCIYHQSGAKSEITMTIEPASLTRVSHRMVNPKSLSVGNRRGYCGRLGTDTLYIPLSSGKLLHVTAPCSIAERFAARALSNATA